MICQVCGYHSGPITPSQRMCPRAHLYRDPWPGGQPQLADTISRWARSSSPHRAEVLDGLRGVAEDRGWEVPASAWAETSEPVERCEMCGGTGMSKTFAGDPVEDCCPRCWGAGKED